MFPLLTRRRAQLVLVVLLVALTSACTNGAGDAELAKATGPPSVDREVARRHAEQFDSEVPIRPAGSQEEELASAYLLGHMQQAGYLVRLDGVPVKDLVRSTNVIAPPPSGADPTVIVAVAYDTAREGPSDGAALGLWLELARALNVAEPDHTAMFVALGANRADAEGAPLGERRLTRFLEEEALEPTVIDIVRGMPPIEIGGPLTPGLEMLLPYPLGAGTIEGCGPTAIVDGNGDDCDPLSQSGLDHSRIAGPPGLIGPLLLRYLSEEHS